MNKCLTCGAELSHTEGKRPKKYCNQTCKQKHWNINKKEPMKCIPIKLYEELMSKAATHDARYSAAAEVIKNQGPVTVTSTADKMPGESSIDYRIRIEELKKETHT